MEAASVIWVSGINPPSKRSNMLRSIDKICRILTDVRQVRHLSGYGMISDPTYATCSLPWPSVLSRCNTCEGEMALCNNCAQFCHFVHGHSNLEWDWKHTVRHWMLPFTSQCSCDDNGCCKLKVQVVPNPDIVNYKFGCLSILALSLSMIFFF